HRARARKLMQATSSPASGNGACSTGSVEVLIVGAGFSGLGMAIKPLDAGITSFLVIEKADEIGGTWYFNRYPGCACDIPAHLYSFSFERNPEWSRMYVGREEIQQYLKSCVQRYDLGPYIRLNTALCQAVWDEKDALWRITTADGQNIVAQVLVSAVGGLHVPKYPDIPGMENFTGPAFHSTSWDSSVTFQGKRVAVIGTGASAIQFVPQIAPETDKLYLFQRTPPWIVPKADFEIPERWRRRFRRFPALGWLFRTGLFWFFDLRVFGFLRKGWLRTRAAKMAMEHLEAQVP